MIPGFLITSLVSAVTTPLDALKTRIQSKGITDYKIVKGITKIYKKEGLTGLFAGMQWRMLKNSIHTSLYLFIYEWLMQRVRYGDIMSTNVEEW